MIILQGVCVRGVQDCGGFEGCGVCRGAYSKRQKGKSVLLKKVKKKCLGQQLNLKVAVKKAQAKQGKVYVGKLKAELSDEEIKTHFEQFGQIAQV